MADPLEAIQEARRRAGERVEASIVDQHPAWGVVPDRVAEHYDVVAIDDVHATDTLAVDVPGDVVPAGTRGEIKSAMARIAGGRRGRFNLRRGQHQRLVDVDGVYIFAVATPTPDRDVLAAKVVPAARIDDYPTSWVDFHNPGRSEAAFQQIAWSTVIDPSTVPDEGGQR